MGTVLAVTPGGLVTARAPGPDVVPEGALVRAGPGTFAGRVVRVFGPVRRPFLAIRPREPLGAMEAARLIGLKVRTEER